MSRSSPARGSEEGAGSQEAMMEVRQLLTLFTHTNFKKLRSLRRIAWLCSRLILRELSSTLKKREKMIEFLNSLILRELKTLCKERVEVFHWWAKCVMSATKSCR